MAEVDGQIVAHAFVQLIDRVPRPIEERAHLAYLTNVYTRPEFRGQGIGTQVIAAILFVVTLLAIIEITLISYLASPAKTQVVVQRLHDWALAHRQKILVAMCTVAGLSLVANGLYHM